MRWLTLFLLLWTPLFSHTPREDQLYLSLNIEEGKRLQLSNGSMYAIAPADQFYAAYWITPFPIKLSESGDPDYPTKITNLDTGTFVRAKQLVATEVIEEQRQKRLEDEKRSPQKQVIPRKRNSKQNANRGSKNKTPTKTP